MKNLLLLSIVTLLISCQTASNKADLPPEEVKKIAKEAYIYAYPMLENYKTMFVFSIWEDSPSFVAPFNTLYNTVTLRSPKDRDVVRPNNDTYYTQAALDLRREPMVLSVPAINDGRYYSFQLIDLYTHNFDYIGTRSTGFDDGNYIIAGPGWIGDKPEGINEVIRSETNLAIALGRTQVYGPGDTNQAQEVMAAYTLQPLSTFMGEEVPEVKADMNFPPYDPEKVRSAEFISYFNFLLTMVDPSPSEKELFDRFSKIGIGSGRTFNSDSLEPRQREAIEAGIAEAMEQIEAEIPNLGERKNGWMLVAGAFGDRNTMQGRYLTRASAAMFGIYGNNLEEAYYPETTVDADGDELNGSQHNYMIHFDKDQLPPVKAFWSLTMYSLPEQLLIENEIDRYKIGGASEGIKYNDDGSLDIYIQRENPASTLESNWLPAHDGKFSLQARFYWPEPDSLDPLYVPPVVQKNND